MVLPESGGLHPRSLPGSYAYGWSPGYRERIHYQTINNNSVSWSARRASIRGYSRSASHMVVYTVMLIVACLQYFSVYSEDK